METWYKACFGRIEPVQVIKETAQKVQIHQYSTGVTFYEFKGVPGDRSTGWKFIRRDRAEAKRLMVEQAKKELAEAKRQLDMARSHLEKCKKA